MLKMVKWLLRHPVHVYVRLCMYLQHNRSFLNLPTADPAASRSGSVVKIPIPIPRPRTIPVLVQIWRSKTLERAAWISRRGYTEKNI